MADLLIDDPCIVFALRREAGPFLEEFRPNQRFAGAPCRARFCGPAWLPVLVLETGVGERQAERALEWVLGRPMMGNLPYRPKILVSAGFSGALCSERKVGDIVLASEVTDQDSQRWFPPWPGTLPPGEWRPPLHLGRILSTGGIASPQEKQTLGQQYGALAVDMESAAVARLCSKHGVPFGCVRVISDEVSTRLDPRLLSLLSGGRVAPLRVLTALARSPRLARELWRLSRQTRLAAVQLGKALGELLTLTLDWGQDL